MLKYELASITIQQMQTFISIAETRSFTHSAQILNMTQPGISKSLSKLEETLGYALFIRNNKNVIPTPAGEVLFQRWQQALIYFEDACLAAKLKYDTDSCDLSIGVPYTVQIHSIITPYIDAWKTQYPNQKMHVIEESVDNLKRHFDNQKIDIMLLPHIERYAIDTFQWDWRYIAYGPMAVFVNPKHPLARQTEVSLNALAQYPQILFDPAVNYTARNYLEGEFASRNLTLEVGGFYKSSFELNALLMDSSHVFLADQYFSFPLEGNYVKIPITDLQGGIVCAWDKNIAQSSVAQFLSLMDDICPLSNSGNKRL